MFSDIVVIIEMKLCNFTPQNQFQQIDMSHVKVECESLRPRSLLECRSIFLRILGEGWHVGEFNFFHPPFKR